MKTAKSRWATVLCLAALGAVGVWLAVERGAHRGPKPQVEIDLGDGVTMGFVLIRPGSFTMGSDQGESDARPAHRVTIAAPFYLGNCEVTQEQWHAVVASNPSQFKGPKNPVEQVSWGDCQRFLSRLSQQHPGETFRLPTEAEWEYACRAGSGGTGFQPVAHRQDACATAPLGDYAWFAANSGNTTHPVGQKRPNPWGLYDVLGNVWEWCQDWYGPYQPGDQTDPRGPAAGVSRVLRGGALDGSPRSLRSDLRNRCPPDGMYANIGLRVVLAPGSR
jgi:formylglycine-generating enzyme required for sulfatase activity